MKSLFLDQNLFHRYPQLHLPIRTGMKSTPEYRKAVLRGEPVYTEPAFIGSPEDSLTTVETPVGPVDVLYLAEREDFEHALRALAYRCEPVEIPASVGASTVRGLINWEKIHAHKAEYLAGGGTNWSEEFKRFTAEKKNYLDTIIVLSKGQYSAVPASAAGLSEKEWEEKSLIIRKYHELTHFVCRILHPKDIEPIRDEVIADRIGLAAAFGYYDPTLAKQFLGIEGTDFRPGGRLSHYAKDETLPAAMATADRLNEELASKRFVPAGQGIFALMLAVIHEYYSVS